MKELLQQIIGDYMWQLIVTIVAIIPTWFITNALKNRLSTWWKRKVLINQSIISIGNWYEICGKIGKLIRIGKSRLELESEDELLFHIPIDTAYTSPIACVSKPKDKNKDQGDQHD